MSEGDISRLGAIVHRFFTPPTGWESDLTRGNGGCAVAAENGLAGTEDAEALPLVLRITNIATEDGTILRIAGRLSGDGVAELKRLCRDVSWPLRLDPSDLRNVDNSGLAALRKLVAQGAELANVPPFTALLLEGEEPQGSGG